jgi:hypothetical protein
MVKHLKMAKNEIMFVTHILQHATREGTCQKSHIVKAYMSCELYKP